MSIVVGVDVGGTTTEAVAYDPAGTARGRAHAATRRGADGVTETVARVVGDVLPMAGAPASAVGVGIPGAVDPVTGTVALAVNLDIGDDPVPLVGRLASRLGTDVVIENDVRCAAVGAYEHLSPGDATLRHLAFLGIGTGISAGVVLDGRLHRGRHGMAGEIGHVVVAPDGPGCRCGLRGCLETVASGSAIASRWPSAPGGAARSLFAAAADGDDRAAGIAHDVVRHLATALDWLVAGYAVDVVVLGGGVGAGDGPLADGLRRHLEERARRSAVARQMFGPDQLVSPPASLSLGARGAAAVAREHQYRDRPDAWVPIRETKDHETT